MKKKINESIQYLFLEYHRLKIKEEEKTISKEEKNALNKLKSFLGKNKK
tara:strand:+ start:153 stop:299 length:147 start_codon:yes stop_codon:yes gene_type:complete